MKNQMAKILFRMFSTRLFCTLTPREREAVAEALRIEVVTTGPISEAERCETRRGVLALPWAWESSFAPEPPADRRAVGLSHVEDAAVLGQLARSLAVSIPQSEVRERVFRAMLALALADGGAERDLALLDPVRSGFGIATARAAEILEDLKDELVSLVS